MDFARTLGRSTRGRSVAASALLWAAAALLWASPVHAAEISLQTSDGLSLAAVEDGAGALGVVLVHEKGRSGSDWSAFTKTLVEAGFHVVAVDLRGHGRSTVEGAIADADYPKMIEDVTAAIAYLRAHGATSVALVGAELGANLAVNAAAADTEISNLVLLSAGLNIKGVTTGGAIDQYGERPVLIVASQEESYPHKSALALNAKAKGAKHYEMLNGAGSGVRMLTRDPDLPRLVLSWLDGSYFTQQAAGPNAEKKVDVDATTSIETTGTKFGEKK